MSYFCKAPLWRVEGGDGVPVKRFQVVSWTFPRGFPKFLPPCFRETSWKQAASCKFTKRLWDVMFLCCAPSICLIDYSNHRFTNRLCRAGCGQAGFMVSRYPVGLSYTWTGRYQKFATVFFDFARLATFLGGLECVLVWVGLSRCGEGCLMNTQAEHISRKQFWVGRQIFIAIGRGRS